MYFDIDVKTNNLLPLLSEERKLFDLVRCYTNLTDGISEFACGNRADVLIACLYRLGVDPEAVRYGLAIEPDLSTKALEEMDHNKRSGAMIVLNKLSPLIDFKDAELLEKLKQHTKADIDVKAGTISVPGYEGDLILHTDEELGFNFARSHIFPIVRFYDEDTGNTVMRALDPVFEPNGFFDPTEIRVKLNCPQAALFASEILGGFDLIEDFLTEEQRSKLNSILDGRALGSLEGDEKNNVIRIFFNDSPIGSVGDPEQWAYYNNWVPKEELEQVKKQKKSKELVHRSIIERSLSSEKTIEPLVDLINAIEAHKSDLALGKGMENVSDILAKPEQTDMLNGFGKRLKTRHHRMARVSRNERYEVDARTFTPEFEDANIELIKQMNEASLCVFIDKVGNIHGISSECRESSVEEDASRSLAFHSHIDTVFDAGIYDGRLGVLSGVEIAQILKVLGTDNSEIQKLLSETPVMISSYVNEEMTYTGEGISMPGSSAVAGTATIDGVYKMKGPEGKTYKEGLKSLVQRLKKEQKSGTIKIKQDLSKVSVLSDLLDPTFFLPKQAIERHCEQADKNMKAGVPVSLIRAIMGIRQEDIIIEGENAEKAALALIVGLRSLNIQDQFLNTRATNGSLKKSGSVSVDKPVFALTFVLKGKKDHAGATSLQDRFDPAVAAAKLAEEFIALIESFNASHGLSIIPVIGDLDFYAKYSDTETVRAQGRNAVAEAVVISIGVSGGNISKELWQDITASLEQHLKGNTKQSDQDDSRDLLSWCTQDCENIEKSKRLVLALDLRDSESSTINGFLTERDKISAGIEQSCDVKIGFSIEQQLTPLHLDKSGNVALILDASLGGSHNPKEVEIPEVELAGTILQIAATLDFIGNPDQKIYDIIQRLLPDVWKNESAAITSGALHDTCQISDGICRKNQEMCSNTSLMSA